MNNFRQYSCLNKILINDKILTNNYRYLINYNPKIKIAPVLKSNAYGHGLVLTAKILEKHKPEFFCVDSLYEAYELDKADIKTPILIMGFTDISNLKTKKLPFIFAVWDINFVKALNEFQPGCKIHIFVDTGMNREGIPVSMLNDFLKQLKLIPNIKINGLMSHLACSDNPKSKFNHFQIKNFQEAIRICEYSGVKPKYIHLANSSGLLNFPKIPGNIARTGLALYGISKDSNLKPVLKLTTKLVQIKSIAEGDCVGYGNSFKAKKKVVIGILPLGYHDGIDLRLINKGSVLIGDCYCRIIGRVNMNITTIDITNLKNPYISQEVTIYSDYKYANNSILKSAQICQTIPYQVLANLAFSTHRKLI